MTSQPSKDRIVPGTATGDDKMDSDVETIRIRLKSLFTQLQTESAILERIVHKNKNQHRRSGYFQYLLKFDGEEFQLPCTLRGGLELHNILGFCVFLDRINSIPLFSVFVEFSINQVRRDLRLVQSAKLGELSALCFQVLTDEKPKQKIQLLENLKRKKCDRRKPNFLEQLLGAARLLSQVIEPMLKAAGEISILLAQSFFMGFSLTNLSLLARLRVLVQQILVDIVSIFNMVSSLSQKRHSVKIIQEGVEVFREFYPIIQDFTTLECIWKSDRFILVEKMHKADVVKELDNTDDNMQAPSIRYESIESFLGDEEPASAADEKPAFVPKSSKVDRTVAECSNQIKEDKTEFMVDPPKEVDTTVTDDPIPESKSSADVAFSSTSVSSLPILEPLKLKSVTEPKRVAFLSVKKPCPSKPIPPNDAHKKNNKNEDLFFNLLTSGNLQDSLF